MVLSDLIIHIKLTHLYANSGEETRGPVYLYIESADDLD